MVKSALLVGVSEYQPELTPLPSAVQDVEAMAKVLKNRELGGFDEIKILKNPDPQSLREFIETLFSGRTKNDLVLLFFSGHGIKDDSGKLYFATSDTQKTSRGELKKSTAVPASFVHDMMNDSRCKRQIAILDCCFSGAFAEGMTAKDDGVVDIKTQLGGEGRAILTSSTSTQYSFEQEGSDLSVYTRYIVEGIQTGAADLNQDGAIFIDELHDYARKKVQEVSPAMKPKIFAVEEGFKICLANASIDDPHLRYRQEAEHYASRGEISVVGRNILQALQEKLGLSDSEVMAIEDEILKPYRDYQRKLQQYEETLQAAVQQEFPFREHTERELQDLRQILALKEDDIKTIENKILPKPADRSKLHQPVPVELNPVPATSPSKQSSTISKTQSVSSNRGKLPLLIGGGITAIGALILTVSSLNPLSNLNPIEQEEVSQKVEQTSEDWLDKGNLRLEEQNYPQAIRDFTKAIKTNPDNFEAYLGRGEAYYEQKEYDRAIRDFNKVLELEPNNTQAYLERGEAFFGKENYKRAIDDLEQVLTRDPKNTTALELLETIEEIEETETPDDSEEEYESSKPSQ